MVRVLFSIKPKYCKLIAEGKKTLEIRTTVPRQWRDFYNNKQVKVPYNQECLIYCTKAKNKEEEVYINDKCINGTIFASFNLKTVDKYIVDVKVKKYIFNNFAKQEDDLWKTEEIWSVEDNPDKQIELFEKSCLTYEEISNYVKNKFVDKPVYALHIDDFKILNEPKLLKDFKLNRPPQSWYYM